MSEAKTGTTPDRSKILIITGHHYFHHRWGFATQYLRGLLEETDAFEVKVVEEFRGATAATLEGYDAVILNYHGAVVPGEEERRFGEETETAFFDYVRGGGGLVLYHGALWNAVAWNDAHEQELLRVVGILMQPTSRRAPDLDFEVTIADEDDPITAGLPPTFMQVWDDKYVNARWAPDAKPKILATVEDDPSDYLDGVYYAVQAMPGEKLYDLAEAEKLPGVGGKHPVVWTNTYGKGRVFAIAIGHIGHSTPEAAHRSRIAGRDMGGPSTDQAARTSAFITMFRRGTEWAATGRVTLPVSDANPAPMPDKGSARGKINLETPADLG